MVDHFSGFRKPNLYIPGGKQRKGGACIPPGKAYGTWVDQDDTPGGLFEVGDMGMSGDKQISRGQGFGADLEMPVGKQDHPVTPGNAPEERKVSLVAVSLDRYYLKAVFRKGQGISVVACDQQRGDRQVGEDRADMIKCPSAAVKIRNNSPVMHAGDNTMIRIKGIDPRKY